MRITSALTKPLAVLSVGALALTGCSTAETSHDSKVKVVASTQIWADVVDALTDDPDVDISAIITGNNMDPHSFEPTAKDMAKAEKADVIVVGGGGYDSWLYSKVDESKVVHAMDLTGHDHEHGHEHGHAEASTPASTETHDDHAEHAGHEGHNHGAAGAEENEHVWYNPTALDKVVDDTAAAIKAKKSDAQINPEAAKKKIAEIDNRIHALPELKVAQTHPIADHILAHTHMTDATPAGYRAATLNESEPAAGDVQAFLELIESGQVQALIDTPQTSTPYSTRIREAAEAKHLPIIPVNETPDSGVNFFDFFATTVAGFEQAAPRG